MPIEFACPSCARQYSVKVELAGKGAKCGQCGQGMKIPRLVAAAIAALLTRHLVMRALVMPIEFACPSCARQYSVKDELAGKGAKCGQCGHRMKIPRLIASASAAPLVTKQAAAAKLPATQAAASRSASKKLATPAPAATKAVVRPVLAKSARAKSAVQVAPPKTSPKSAPSDSGMSSWLDEELETARVEAKAKPKPPSADASCPSCSGALAVGTVVCVKCGYDTRIRGKRSVERGSNDAPAKKRSKLGSAASLLRGTFFSFLGAMLGAAVWAVLTYFTLYEFSIVAWGLGGLAGLGMALGHEADDGTFAGIVAAFMSLVGIVAAKVFIVIIFVAAAVSTIVNDVEINAHANPVEMQRSMLAMTLAMKDLESTGESIDDVDDARWDAALSKSREAVAALTSEEIEARFNELGQEHGLDGEVEGFDEQGEFAQHDAADEETFDDANLDDGDLDGDGHGATFGSVVGSLFGPMDGLFILLAFFTAYKVGSGEATD